MRKVGSTYGTMTANTPEANILYMVSGCVRKKAAYPHGPAAYNH